MEESQEILLSSLESSGITIPSGVSSVKDLTPPTLFSICIQALSLMDHDNATKFPSSLPDSVAEQFKVCTDIASAVKDLGFVGDMSFHTFLYPSEEDLYKLVRFLVERLFEASQSQSPAVMKDVNGYMEEKEESFKHHMEDKQGRVENDTVDLNYQNVENKFNDLRMETVVAKFSNNTTSWPSEDHFFEGNIDKVAKGDVNGARVKEALENERIKEIGDIDDVASSKKTAASANDGRLAVFRQEPTSLARPASNIGNDSETEVSAHASELQQLMVELESLKAASDMAFDEHHPIDFYINQLEEKIDSMRLNLMELKSQWVAEKELLEKRKQDLEEVLYANDPEAQEKLEKLRELEVEKQFIKDEIQKRKAEHSKLSSELEKQPKQASRRSYINRVKEITKNSWKQDADIERILKETRELQLESNSIQERLHRTYAIIDELVFREAKKDPVGRQAYRLLTSIHQSFEHISEKILATDRARREASDYEKKLGALTSRRLNVDKLQSDLEAIKRENERLEQRLHDS